ncbi:hypothetical protein BS50DRAFT_651205 [Corynespora cassiicola Philippines]|uniref:Xylanolytic transcriptional activator regulatory domain-containing protein n=1 Tax=Corynespora cassiicola Philippines TaxID=1448308 RepID=A0A2T2N8N8_CORCC|nr:hypothetical protein BS50DRAFT_651205 [Corynespora cassiicola Philippines]
MFPSTKKKICKDLRSTTLPNRLTRVSFSLSLKEFFNVVQDINPIFSRERFIQDYRRSKCNRDVITTIIAITSKLIGSTSTTDDLVWSARIDSLLSSSSLDEDISGDSLTLDQFRKGCLLAFYEFHQYPGNQSWMRIGKLTRMAYRIGLDRLESLRTSYSDWRAINNEDIEEWRAVWWCIYRLDSYSNLASGTPYLIEEKLINTALSLGYLAPDGINISSHYVLESCQHVVAISEQWDSSFSLRIDPAISFIIFTALIFLDLHKKSVTIYESDVSAKIDHGMTILRLHLEQFASTWTLPRLLVLSFRSFSESAYGPFSYHHIVFILSHFEAPLHPRWLQFLSSARLDIAGPHSL